MRHTFGRALAVCICCVLIAAACGGSDGDTAGTAAATDPPATEPVSTDPPPTDPPPPDPPATEPPTTEPPATDPPATDPPPTEPPPTDPPPTDPPSTDPPEPLNVVGLVPLPGRLLDFSANPVRDSGLVWSMYSGSGGVIVEHIGGPLPPGCYGVSFFDPQTFELVEIDGEFAHAYATRGEGGCDGMQQQLDDGVVDGAVVSVNTDDLIIFDFGSLPDGAYDVSTQILNPDGQDGVFRAADPDDVRQFGQLGDADWIITAGGLIERSGDDLTARDPGAPSPGDCAGETLCLFDRFGVDVLEADRNPATLHFAGPDAAFFTFSTIVDDDWGTLVRIVDGCSINDRFWVFAAASTNVEYDVTVTDTLTGDRRAYESPGLSEPILREPILDTAAFATCP